MSGDRGSSLTRACFSYVEEPGSVVTLLDTWGLVLGLRSFSASESSVMTIGLVSDRIAPGRGLRVDVGFCGWPSSAEAIRPTILGLRKVD